ncbi:hypothetical protein GCM10025734_72060 [Kitasatospora paranensis]
MSRGSSWAAAVIGSPLAGQEQLLDVEVAGAEAGLGVGEVELPHAAEDPVEAERGDLFGPVGETLPPQPEGLGVVRAVAVGLGQAQGGVLLGGLPDGGDGGDESAREDVLEDPGVGLAAGEHPVVRHGDGLQGDLAAGGQHAVQGGEVVGPEGAADGLDHLDADHGVVLAVGGAVVAQPHLGAVALSGVGDPAAGEGELLLGEGEADDAGAAGGGAQGEFAPAGADLQDAAAGTDGGEVEQPVDLPVLGLGEGVPGRLGPAVRTGREDRRGVGHGRVEEEREQLVRQVVVAADVLLGVVGGGEFGVRRALHVEAAQPLRAGGDEGLGGGGERGQQGDEVGGVPVAGLVGLAEADQAARADPVQEGLGAVQAQHGCAGGCAHQGPAAGEFDAQAAPAGDPAEQASGDGGAQRDVRDAGDVGPPAGVDGVQREGLGGGAGHGAGTSSRVIRSGRGCTGRPRSSSRMPWYRMCSGTA